MRVAYADTSCLVAVALGEATSADISGQLEACDVVIASNLLEAELRSVLVREHVTADPAPLLARLSWVHPNRALRPEFVAVLEAGQLRGADLWHLACALYVRKAVSSLGFLSLDHRQKSVATALGFPM